VNTRYQSTSDDFGLTWTTPLPVGGPERTREGGIRHPLAPPNVERIDFADGTDAIVLVTEPHFTAEPWSLGQREVLGLQVSRDYGKSWGSYMQLEAAPNSEYVDSLLIQVVFIPTAVAATVRPRRCGCCMGG
jgi:hypothetical protein